MKVLLTGSHGTGKSTLADLLAAALDWPIVKEGAREVLKRNNISENLGTYPIDKQIDVQYQIMSWHKAEREKHENCIEDRGLVDVLAYSHYWLSREEEAQKYIAELESEVDKYAATNAYDLIIMVPPTIPLVADGLRAESQAYRNTIHLLLRGILEQYAYRYTVLMPTALHDRLRESVRLIRKGSK